MDLGNKMKMEEKVQNEKNWSERRMTTERVLYEKSIRR